MTRRLARKILRSPHRYTGRQVITAASRVRPSWWPIPVDLWGDRASPAGVWGVAIQHAEQDRPGWRVCWYRRVAGDHRWAMRRAYATGTAKDPDHVPF